MDGVDVKEFPDVVRTHAEPALAQAEAAPATPGLRRRRFLLSMSPATWLVIDLTIIALATAITHAFMVFVASGFEWIANPWLASTALCVCTIVAGLVFGLFERDTLWSRSAVVFRTVMTALLGVVLAFAVLTLFFYASASRWVGLVVAILYIAAALPLRLYAHGVITEACARVLCVGAGESIRRLVNSLNGGRHRYYQIVGHLQAAEGVQRLVAATHQIEPRPRFWSEAELQFEESCPHLGRIEDIGEVIAENGVDEVVFGAELSGNAMVGPAVAACLERRCRVTDQATFVEKLLGEVPADSITAEWFLRADVQNHGSYDAVKRVMDVIVSAIGLVLTLPFMPIVALIIRLDSPGAALYKQSRVGQHGRIFNMYKFRTMRSDAEKDGAKWAQQNDTRVTRIGRFLRRSRIDELPQLFNILRGDMSLVGPRPERPEFVRNLEQLLPHYRLRHLVKPGLSGWAQIHYGYAGNVEDTLRKLCYDLYYLKHRSLETDMAILMRTFGTFVLGAR